MRGNLSTTVLGALATAAVAALALAGCAGSGTPATQAAGDPVGTWGDPSASGEPWLSLSADGTLGGNDGCNTLFGTWETDDDDATIEFGDLAATRMFCEGVDVWLSAADSARIDGDTMTVFADGEVEIGTLERTDSAPTTVSPTADPSAPPTDGAVSGSGFVGTWGTDATGEPFLVIAADGTLSGSDGCNRLTGRWEAEEGGAIEFDDVASTLMACEGVDQSLNRLDSATVDGDTLTVIDDHDAVIATLTRTA